MEQAGTVKYLIFMEFQIVRCSLGLHDIVFQCLSWAPFLFTENKVSDFILDRERNSKHRLNAYVFWMRGRMARAHRFSGNLFAQAATALRLI